MQVALPPAVPQGTPSGLGFMLQPGERILFAKRPKSALTGLYIAGALLSWLMGIGFILLIVAITQEKSQGKLFAVTTHRLVLIDGNGRETSYWFQAYRDLEPTRRDLNVGGGGLIGGLISAAVTAAADARLANQHKLQPTYWTRTIALNFTEHSGRRVSVDLGQEGEQLALPVAHVFLGNLGPQMPTYDLRFLTSQPAAVPGVGLTLMGALLTFYGLLGLAVSRLGLNVFLGSLGTSFALFLVAVGGLLFTLGTLSRTKAKKARGQAASPALPLGLFGAITTAAIVGAFVYKRKGFDDDAASRPVKPVATAPGAATSNGSARPSASAAPALAHPPALTLAAIGPYLKKHALTWDKDHAFEGPHGPGIAFAMVSGKDATGNSFSLEVNDFTRDDVAPGRAKVCKFDPAKWGVCVTALHGPDNEKTARALLEVASKKPMQTQADLEAAMRGGGVPITDRSLADILEIWGVSEGSIDGKKDGADVTLSTFYFEHAVQRPEDDVAFAIESGRAFSVRSRDMALRKELLEELMGHR
ncbi:MAG: hypothetical protein U0414_39550 [Polyangiaceae bacterium]